MNEPTIHDVATYMDRLGHRARAAKTGQLAVLDPQRGYVARTVAEEEAA